MSQHRKAQTKESSGLDLGLGALGLGGLFDGIDKLLDVAGKFAESSRGMTKEGEFDLSHVKKGMKGVFGISVKTAGGGKPVVESFGNIRNTPKGPQVDAEREPIIDVFDEAAEMKIYAEMPGVAESDIKLDLKGDILDISAGSDGRKYHKEVLLPSAVKPGTLVSSYKNGILEVKIAK